MLTRVGRHVLVGTPTELLAKLERMHLHDKRAEKLASRSRKLTLGGAVTLGVLSLPVTGPFGLIGAVGGGMFGSWLIDEFSDSFNLDDHKVEACRTLLRTLEVDLRPDVQLKLTVDFRQPTDTSFTTKTIDGNERAFGQTWLNVRGTLADRTQFELEVTRQGRYRKKPKRKCTKLKVCGRDEIRLCLRVDPRHYPGLTNVAALLGPPPLSMRGRVARVSAERLTLQLRTLVGRTVGFSNTIPRFSPELKLATGAHLLGSLAWAWRALKVVKTEEMKKTPA